MQRLAIATAMTVLFGLLAGASPASAMFTNVQTVTKVSALTSAAKTVTATCPAGKRVTGAGGDVSPHDGRVLIDYIRPDATLRTVTVSAHEDEGSYTPDWTVTAYATCAPAPAGLTRVAATSSSSSAASKSVPAICPAGRHVLGTGGELAGAPRQLLLHGLAPSSDLTKVTAQAFEDETGTTAAWTVTAYAICAAPAQPLSLVSRTLAYASTSPRSAARECGADGVAVGMGGQIQGTGNQLVLQGLSPALDGTGPQLTVAEDRTGYAGTWSLTVYTICGRPLRASTLNISGSATMDPYTAGSGCGSSGLLTGSGADITGGLGDIWFDELEPAGDTESDPASTVFVRFHKPEEKYAQLRVFSLCTAALSSPTLARVPLQTDPAFPSTHRATVACPAGTRALSGGDDLADGQPQSVLTGIVPSADLTTVDVVVSTPEPDPTRFFEATGLAVCAAPPPGLQRTTATTAFNAEEFKTATASCAAGKHLVGLGMRVTGGNGRVVVDDLRPAPSLGSATATGVARPGFTGSWGLSAYAVCVTR